jgi:hypothetical protein
MYMVQLVLEKEKKTLRRKGDMSSAKHDIQLKDSGERPTFS